MLDLSGFLEIAERANKPFALIKPKLLARPDEAGAKLAAVLEELSKIYEYVRGELVRYQTLSCKPDGSDLSEVRGALLTMESGALEIEGNQARGHCHKIRNIYDAYLDPWFQRVFPDSTDRQQIRELFELLGNMDDRMVLALGAAASWLGDQARATLDLIDEDRFDAANVRFRDARKELSPLLRDLTRALGSLRGLQADFIAASGSV